MKDWYDIAVGFLEIGLRGIIAIFWTLIWIKSGLWFAKLLGLGI